MKIGVGSEAENENRYRERERERERDVLELAMEISLHSLGSSQTFPFPHLRTLAESRFCSFNDTIDFSLCGSASGSSLPEWQVEEGFSRMKN